MKPGLFFTVLLAASLILFVSAHAQVCGNGVRESPEQCDDGNRASFDACSARCTFEQSQRINQLKMQFATSPTCTVNALGSAFPNNLIQSQLQTAIDSSVKDGSTSALMYFIGLDDLSGTSASSLQLGLFNAAPQSSGGGYDGNNDVDWWYLVDDSALGASQNPLNLLNGYIASNRLNGGPGSFALTTNLGTPNTTLSISSLRLSVAIGASSVPMTYVGGTDRGHQASENLDPLLQSFASAGTGNPPNGTMCGNVSAASLAATQLSTSVVQNCTSYTIQNSMLDLIAGGCTAFGIVQLVLPTQPDQIDPDAPVAGAGGPYRISASTGKAIDTCKDKNNSIVPLATCLNAAAYSSSFLFSTDRVIAKSAGASDIIFYDDFE